MRELEGKIDRDIEVLEDLRRSGQVTGNVTVHAGAHLSLSGQTTGNVIVLKGGWLHQFDSAWV